ncbi:MAG: lysophospholipid acyltransferase family protein [Chloracidobacterium sp.]|nr:lysophospholipid acyltransferase family protein [Chloracidobacterium sp.]
MRKKSRPVVWLEYAAVRGLLGFLGLLPRRAAVAAASGAAVAGYYVLGRLRRVAFTNLRIAFPDLDEAGRRRLAKGAFRNLGRIIGEMSQFAKASREDVNRLIEFRIDPEVYNTYKRLQSEGRGVIIVTPHLGNWEVLVFGWAVHDGPMSYLARPIDNPMIERLTHRLRTKFGNRPIGKSNSVMAASRVLREEGLLGILADVNAHPKEGVFVPFFGKEACTSTGVALLALRTNSMILPMCAAWDEAEGRYMGIHGPLMEPIVTGDRKEDVKRTTAAFTAELEKFVRRYPDQWLWIHKRWKTRPPGEPSIY